MPETPAPPGRKPRFPWAAALLCAACIGAAVWTWMRYSYAWSVEGDMLVRAIGTEAEGRLHDAYVSVPGPGAPLAAHEAGDEQAGLVWVSLESGAWGVGLYAVVRGELDMRNMSVHPVPSGPFRGRMSFEDWGADFVDTTASRFTGASVAGLVVGAMGVFVFALHLRTWVKERRAGQGGMKDEG